MSVPTEGQVIGCMSPKIVEQTGKPYTPYKDSIVVKCPECGDDMWLPPASREKHEQEGVPIFCFLCIIKSNPTAINNMKTLTNKNMGE